MVFSSLIFLFFFLPAALFCYYIVPQKFIRVRNAVLLLFSLFFYFYGEPRLIGMLIFSILMNYLFGLSMRSTYRKPLLILCVIANLSLLGVFKYLNFFISTADSLLGLSIPVTGIVMPIGISFYTFQALSYVIDVYRREVPPQHDPFSLALYVSMFPQLIAGPIVRYHDVNVQLAVRKHSFAQFSEGISRFLFGLSKKVLLSNVFAQIADGVFKYAPSELSAAGAWMGAIGYTLQIYFDFSGYSDMAIGLGKMFGFEFLENFNYPYISKSVTEFWRRWHISLSTWFRDYLYFPLGGSRKGKARTYINVLIVFALSGLWHGAAMKYVLWGLLFGVFQVIGGLLKPAKQRLCAALHIPWDAGWLQIIRVIITFGLSTFAWIFFRADSALQACAIIKRIVTAAGACFPLNLTHLGLTERALNVLAVSLIGLVLTDIIGDRFPLREKLLETVWLRYAVWVILLAVTAVCGAYGTGFNPQEFVYFQF